MPAADREALNLCRQVSIKTGLPMNSVIICYFMEKVLEILSLSDHSRSFIFKGGFLLSNIVGIKTRHTADIDFLFKNLQLSESELRNVLLQAFSNPTDDGTTVTLMSISETMLAREYPGYTVTLQCNLGSIRQVVRMDITTGDLITPGDIKYKYRSNFTNKEFLIHAYPIESIIPEKLETIASKATLNSRCKDYFDLYLLWSLQKDVIDIENLQSACIKTFRHLKTDYDISSIQHLINTMQENEVFLKHWRSYAKKHAEAQNIGVSTVCKAIREILENLN